VDTIRLTGLVVTGTHGALPEEQTRAQPFRIDVEIGLDLEPAGESDDLDDTLDYGALAGMLARIVRTERHQLLERLASRLIEACLADPRVEAATVEVTKLRPPVAEALDAASVRLTRSRT
jgi:dihydroneopterin aldolase